jgi:hypothetical protein
MEESATESKSSDFLNVFDELLGESDSNTLGMNIKAYTKGHPKNIVFTAEIYNGETSVWRGDLDISESENKLRAISEKLDTVLNIVDINESKVVLSFNKGKTVLGLDYKSSVKRDLETKKLVNIYSKK